MLHSIPVTVKIYKLWATFVIYVIVTSDMQQAYSIPAGAPATNTEPPIVSGGGNRDGLKSIISTLAILIAAPITALLLTTYVFQSYEVDGPSMETTLHNQDRLIVWKLPRTISRMTKKPLIPQRGEVVIFVKRGLFGEGGDEKQLIKRVIGLPGDRVVVRDGQITIYNNENPDGFNPDANHEFSEGIAKHTNGSVDLVVPENEIFVSGDNRPNSLDSRAFGTVPVEDVVGELAYRILPANTFKAFL